MVLSAIEILSIIKFGLYKNKKIQIRNIINQAKYSDNLKPELLNIIIEILAMIKHIPIEEIENNSENKENTIVPLWLANFDLEKALNEYTIEINIIYIQ